MPTRRRYATYALFAVASVLVALAATAMPRRPSPPPPPPSPPVVAVPTPPPPPSPPPVEPPPQVQKAPRVDVVFALDTTGSMDDLIEGAKRKIWNVANFIGSAQPKPELRIGLVGYRDVGDAYVTRFFDLSDDLDRVFQHLSAFRADGGGDTPEHVARALHDAVNRTSWSEGEGVVKIVYLVGDAPPHTDYDDGYNFRAIARRAQQRGIHVNTILCGSDGDARVAWREIARLGGGDFSTVAQSGGMMARTSPYDDKLAELNRRLTSTAIGWGSADRRRTISAKINFAAGATGEAAADRAAFAGRAGLAVSGDGDLVNDLAAGKAKLHEIPRESLPETMQAMPAPAQAAYVAEKQAERKKIVEEINSLSTKRDAYLKAAKPAKGAPSFDDEVRRSVAKDAPMLSF